MFTRIILIVMLLAAACTPNLIPESAPAQGPKVTEEISSDPTATSSPIVESGLEKKFIGIVMADLATRLSMEAQAISVISAEAITWPNAALGCPLPGKVYAQGTVPGFRIRLKAENKEYSYHTDRTGQFVLCLEEGPDVENLPSIPVPPGEIDDGKPWIPAD
jgi:hypothetical protein